MPADKITFDSIRELMEMEGPCLTLVYKGAPPKGVQAPAEAQAAIDALPATGMSAKQVAVLRSPSLQIVCHVDESVTPIAQTGDRFDLRTLMAIAAAQRSFYILALSQRRTRLLACTHDSSEEVPLGEGIPVSLEESMQTRKPDHTLKNMNTAGPSSGSSKGVMSGTNTDREDKDEYMLHFFQALDRGVVNVLKDPSDPLVIVGVEHELALYRRVNTYTKLVEPGVHGAPDGLEGGEMHRRALEILDGHFREPAVELLRDFDKKIGTGHASAHVQEIVAAAFEGRVSHLYFQSSAQYTGSYDRVRQRVKHADEVNGDATDLIESAAMETLLHGGQALMVDGSVMPNGVPVCALFRYAAPKAAPAPAA